MVSKSLVLDTVNDCLDENGIEDFSLAEDIVSHLEEFIDMVDDLEDDEESEESSPDED